MIDWRLYRLSFLPAVLAVVTMMFSLEGPADPLEPAIPPGSFDGGRAAGTARLIADVAPEREPGGPGDAEVADLVAGRFGEVRAGTVSEQTFEASLDGDEVELRNVLLTLPGDAAATVVVVAPRSSSRDPGAATTAAATGVLVELASALGVASHEKTFVLGSTPGDGASATGALELAGGLPEREAVEAVVVISQPGAAEPRQPYVVASSTAEQSPPVELRETAALAVETQVGTAPREPSALAELARLAFPSGLGAQAPLIADGTQAVAISSAGEAPLPPSADEGEDVSVEMVDGFGRAVQSTVGALDAATEPLDRGPATYVGVASNLVPGWTLALLALAVILPAVVAAVDGFARAARRSQPIAASLAWALAWALPLLGGLAILYALALVGVIPRPAFPFDPGRHPVGLRAGVSLALMVVAAAATAMLLRRLRIGAGAAPEAAPAALGLVTAVGCLTIWVANPYLGLLTAPAAHVWVLSMRAGGARGAAIAAAAALVAALPPLLALASVAGALDLGADAPWTYALLVADGQIGLGVAAPTCFVAGALVGSIAAAARATSPLAPDRA
ncbi:MAG: hypothetical protein ACRDK9_13300 [Solirubrobacterales bacterium]